MYPVYQTMIMSHQGIVTLVAFSVIILVVNLEIGYRTHV